MKLNRNQDEKKLVHFCTDLFEELQKHPFGSMPKRDLDCLFFFLFEKHGFLQGTSNREKAQSLQINETRLKSYILDAHARYGEDQKTENLTKLLHTMGNKVKVSLEGDYLVFFEENPIVKTDFVQSLKEEGLYTDSSFNNEIIKVKIASFLYFAQRRGMLNKEKLLEILKSEEYEKTRVKDFFNANKTSKEIAGDVLKILQEKKDFGLDTLISLLEYGKDIITAKIK